MSLPQQPSTGSARDRVNRYQMIGSISGTVIGAIVIFTFLAFGEHPHRLGQAIVTTALFIVVAVAFDLFLFRSAKRRSNPPG
jgi:Na+/melibiose symporter-like transporter